MCGGGGRWVGVLYYHRDKRTMNEAPPLIAEAKSPSCSFLNISLEWHEWNPEASLNGR